MKIADREIGSVMPTFIVAELGAAHNGLLDRALTLMEAAKKAGADAFKIQAFRPESITIDSAADDFVIRSGPWTGRNLWDLYSQCAMPREWYPALFERAKDLGIILFASVFSRSDIAWMEKFDCPAYKIASLEIGDHDLIEAVAETGKPIILSSGAALLTEMYDAWEIYCKKGGPSREVASLHCVSEYPVAPDRADLRQMRELPGTRGLSDHSIGSEAAVLAVAMGASIIEKHITLSRDDGGPDDGFASTPEEFAEMVRSVRTARKMLSMPPVTVMSSAHYPLRRSLYAIADIAPGDQFTRLNVGSIRPGFGLPPHHLRRVLGKTSQVTIKAGTPLTFELVGLV